MRKANLMMLVLACVSLILSATACGNGQGKPVFNDNSECEQNCPIEISGGDTVDESGESVACEGQNCPEVVADADNECQNCSDTNDTKQEEATQTVCGNGFCEPEGENCQNCSKDCGCPLRQQRGLRLRDLWQWCLRAVGRLRLRGRLSLQQ